MKKTAILIGATGLTGSILLQKLLQHPDFELIKVLTRRSTGITSPKLEEHIVDLLKLESYQHLFKGTVVYCCIGTTKAKTPDKDLYFKIDYGIPVAAAKLAKEQGIPTYVVISSFGSNPDSKIFYSRTKGKMEKAVEAEQIPNTYILRPSLIVGDRKETRIGERIGELFFRIFNFLIPKRYRYIKAETIAEAMVKLEEVGYPKMYIPSDEIKKIASNQMQQ